MSVVVGIDPGFTGAVSVLVDGEMDQCFDLPFVGQKNLKRLDSDALASALGYPAAYVAIEELQLTGRGIKAAWAKGLCFGSLQTFLECNAFEFETVRPQVWQAEMLPGTKAKDGKRRSVPVASSLFGEAHFHGPRGGQLHDRADSALIAEWARRKMEADR